MFAWWKQVWTDIAQETKEGTKIILCIKGGVNQSSEAARITALSRFGEATYFYDFIQDADKNLLGYPSQYTKPFQGRNYLWNLKQTEALSLLSRWDYPAVQRVLRPYKENADENDQAIQAIWHKLEMAIAWNMADFEAFANLLDESSQQRTKTWWWTAYEAAYLAVIRFQQGNTTEAFFHSFRAVEGLMIEWAIQYYHPHVKVSKGQPRILKRSIYNDSKFPEAKEWNSYFDHNGELKLFGDKLEQLLFSSRSKLGREYHWQVFFKTRKKRNQIFHRLYKLDRQELFQAWNAETQRAWQDKILAYLNDLSSPTSLSLSLESSSLMSSIHKALEVEIQEYGFH